MKTVTKLLIGAAVIIALSIGMFIIASKKDVGEVQQENSSSSAKSSATPEKDESDETIARKVDPCSLLSDSDRATYGLTAGQADNKNLRGCAWKSSSNVRANVKVYPTTTLAAMPGWQESPPQQLIIDSHEAQIASGPAGSIYANLCQVDVAFGPTKTATLRVSANGSYGEAVQQYCDIAKALAKQMATRLP